VQRGDLKYLILQVLKDKSTHGYEIMKVLSNDFGGFYFPSAGAVYPTLQMLEDMEYIKSTLENGKKVYSITPEGLKVLEDKSERLKKIMERRSRYLKTGKFKILRDYRSIANLIIFNYENITPEKIEEIKIVIEETKKKIGSIILK
jgi:DNA-binding PadR family transcriptional regulator